MLFRKPTHILNCATIILQERKFFPRRKCRFVLEAHGVASQTTAFFMVIAVKTSNLTYH
jgi:hypothetical protein